MDEALKKHLAELDDWLEKNIQVFPEPEEVTLSQFSVDWEKFSGNFRVSFDSVALSEKLRFTLEVSGKVKFYLPMFHSPLGAPASFNAIQISDKTQLAILKGLHESIPRVKGAGIDRNTGKQITYHTPIAERIDPEILCNAKIMINDSYSIQVRLKDL